MHRIHLPLFSASLTTRNSKPATTSLWQAAVGGSDLDSGGLNTAEGSSLAVGQLVHGGLGDVEAGGGVVDGQDVDGAATVAQLPASSALRGQVSFPVHISSSIGRAYDKTHARGVPAGDLGGAADVGEVGDGALGLVAVAGDEAVGAVGARDGRHGAAGVIVAGVVGDWMGVLVILYGVVGVKRVCMHETYQ